MGRWWRWFRPRLASLSGRPAATGLRRTTPAWAVPRWRAWWPARLREHARWLLLIPAVGLVLFAGSEIALRSVGPTDAASDTRSHIDTRSGYAAWVFAMLAPPATAVAEQIQQDGIGLFDPPPGPVPGEDFVPPTPTAEASAVAVLITPTELVVNRPPLPTPIVRRSATPSAVPSATDVPPTPTDGGDRPAPEPGPTHTPPPPPTATLTASPVPTRTRAPTRTRVPSATPAPPTMTPTHTLTPTPTATVVEKLMIQGRIRTPGGVSVAGVFVRLSNGAGTFTNGRGSYRFTELPPGVYSVTPSALGCNFSPDSWRIVLSDSDSRDNDFTQFCPDPPTPTPTDLPPTATDPPTPTSTDSPTPTATDPPPTPTDPPTPTATDTEPPPTATDSPVPPTEMSSPPSETETPTEPTPP